MASLYLTEPEALAAGIAAGEVELTGDEARHAAQVARIRAGERIAVGDGAGLIAHGEVLAVAPGSVRVRIDGATREDPPRPALQLAQALAKGDRDELAIQAATELGVDAVIPWAAERSVVRWQGAKVERGVERWRSIVREASKQSIRARVPEVARPATTAELAALAGPDHAVLALDPGGDQALGTLPLPDATSITLVVGPEGGISPRELAELAAAGAEIVRLGAGVLRTSTAGPAALAALNVRLGRW